MRVSLAPFIFLVGCAGEQAVQKEAPAPYKAVVVFEWFDDEKDRPDSGSSETPDSAELRRGLEEKILLGLKEYRVFSDFVRADSKTMDAVATENKADLIVVLRIGNIARWEEKTKIETGPAILEAFLWIGTGVGSWWVPDLEFSTQSDVQVRWKRSKSGVVADRTSVEPSLPAERDKGFEGTERLSSGKYRLSFWDRARPWSSPGAYLLSIFIPPVLVPTYDRKEVQESLMLSALEDIQRELARNFKGGYLTSDAPILFRLKEPPNGALLPGDKMKLQCLYSVQPGFDEHKDKPLRALYVDVKRGDQASYARRRNYTGDEIESINEKIRNKDPLEVEVEGLGPGTNLIRFVALTDSGAEWITNTVALLRQ